MNPILQFGTSRFLQAHADLFLSEAQQHGDALGSITIVQTSESAESARRIAAFNRQDGFPVRIRGWQNGVTIDVEQRVTSVTEALQTGRDWSLIRERVADEIKVILSNTGDSGFQLSADDNAALLQSNIAPVSFPAKLLVLLHGRFRRNAAPITLFPCELVTRNGDVLRELVVGIAREWQMSTEFLAYLRQSCIWVNSLVDRIVSAPIDPIGAVAEPYALWAIEEKPGMVLPCRHPQIIVTDDLDRYVRLKLFLLNLGHSYLAEQWLTRHRPADETVLQAMSDAALVAQLNTVWEEEVLPIFIALDEASLARDYLTQVRERFCNPFLAHRLSDIAQHHLEKKQRRFAPVVALATELGLAIPQRRLRLALGEEQ